MTRFAFPGIEKPKGERVSVTKIKVFHIYGNNIILKSGKINTEEAVHIFEIKSIYIGVYSTS